MLLCFSKYIISISKQGIEFGMVEEWAKCQGNMELVLCKS
uniref:Uncharacterized protein n=1 Tax=Rhizophora mucronata TaxID=61149 RepID=A0A2P2MR18_RHIMU